MGQHHRAPCPHVESRSICKTWDPIYQLNTFVCLLSMSISVCCPLIIALGPNTCVRRGTAQLYFAPPTRSARQPETSCFCHEVTDTCTSRLPICAYCSLICALGSESQGALGAPGALPPTLAQPSCPDKKLKKK